MSAADRIEVRRGVRNHPPLMHDLRIDGIGYVLVDDDYADLFDDLVAAARQAEELRAWKDSALHILGQWEAVYEALGGPGPLGRSKAANALDEVERLIAQARQADEPLPDGMEHTVMASGADILRHGWQWRFSSHDEWRAAYCASSGGPFPDSRYECRPPQQAEPQMVAVMLPADVVAELADGTADTITLKNAAVIDACRAALTEGDES